MKIYENKNLNEMKKIVSTYTKQTSDPEIERAVDDILKDVRVSQDDALRKYSDKFDGVKINDFRVPKEALNWKSKRVSLILARKESCAAKR